MMRNIKAWLTVALATVGATAGSMVAGPANPAGAAEGAAWGYALVDPSGAATGDNFSADGELQDTSTGDRFNPLSAPVVFTLPSSEFANDTTAVTLKINGSTQPASKLAIAGNRLTASGVLVNGRNNIDLLTTDTVDRNGRLFTNAVSARLNPRRVDAQGRRDQFIDERNNNGCFHFQYLRNR
jgi:hypothetical protein